MNTVIAWIKKIRLKQILTVFVAGILLFFTQACNRPTVAGQPPQPSTRPNAEVYVPKGDNVTNPYEGGMNNFSDVDPRSRAAESQAKAKAEYLKENAQRNIEQKGVDSPGQYVENYRQGTPFPERVKNLGEDIGSSAKELTEGVTKGTQRGIENIKGNTEDTARNVTKGTQRAAEDTKINAQRTAEDAANAVNRTFDR
ncbi:DUF6658 family protein [Fischerella sp. PCC 9605]|uniref:DUF6658 family protein n=1 Tax=Fischerella sp. PCC 9605 TaxID=1173024 RepID=UPI00047CD273|nr:DUF6658 family protein [Fischerella sp. PCC 9605]